MQTYDAVDAKALRLDLNSKTKVGNVTSTILHQGENMWIVNKLPWYAAGIHQCICTKVRQAGDAHSATMYPIQYNWTQHLRFVARERIGIEFMEPGRKEILDHWSFGPHHVWSVPESGEIRRMWQPFNGLEIFPNGTSQQTIDPNLFKEIPPALCKKKGGATFRIKCDDDGFPIVKDDDASIKRVSDVVRAKTKTPRAIYRGDQFEDMSSTLNRWMENGKHTSGKMKPCDQFTAQELQKLQALLYLLRHDGFNQIYHRNSDNRLIRKDLETLQHDWNITRKYLDSEGSDELEAIHRDGHCHEALMWYVHHLENDVKESLSAIPDLQLPLLSKYSRRSQCKSLRSQGDAYAHVCDVYEEQVTCSSCHSNAVPPGHKFLM